MNEEMLSEEELERAVKRIFKLSQTDPEFRTLCLGNPNEAIRRITGKAVPDGTRIQFLDCASSEADKSRDAAT